MNRRDFLQSFCVTIGATAMGIFPRLLGAVSARRTKAVSVRLSDWASAVNEVYTGELLAIIKGTGLGQERRIIAYNGATKVASIFPDWDIQPDATSVYQVIMWYSFSEEEAQWEQIGKECFALGNKRLQQRKLEAK